VQFELLTDQITEEIRRIMREFGRELAQSLWQAIEEEVKRHRLLADEFLRPDCWCPQIQEILRACEFLRWIETFPLYMEDVCNEVGEMVSLPISSEFFKLVTRRLNSLNSLNRLTEAVRSRVEHPNQAELEEAIQEVIEDLWERWSRREPFVKLVEKSIAGEFDKIIPKAVRNRLIDNYRRRKRVIPFEVIEISEEDFEEEVITKLLRLEFCGKLNEEERRTFTMMCTGMTNEEISKELRRSVATVKRMKKRIREKLVRFLSHFG